MNTEYRISAPGATTVTRVQSPRELQVERRARRDKRCIAAVVGTLNEVCRQLGAPAEVQRLWGALVELSGGRTVFEASYRDLAEHLFSDEDPRTEAAKKSEVRRMVKQSERLQERECIDLCKVARGRRVGDEYVKTRFDLSLLDALHKALRGARQTSRKARVAEELQRLRGDGYTPEPKRRMGPRKQFERDKKTCATKVAKHTAAAEDDGGDPDAIFAEMFAAQLGAFVETHGRRPKLPPALAARLNVEAVPAEPAPKPEQSERQEQLQALAHEANAVTSQAQLPALAESYARAGYLVLPLHWLVPNPTGGLMCSCPDGADCPAPGKHPLIEDWSHRATAYITSVRSWCERWPLANIAYLTGRRAGIWALDVDRRNGGERSLAELECNVGSLPETAVVVTPGGWHYQFANESGGYVPPCSSGILASGLDVKGEGGYVVAAGSLHVSGKRYRFETPAPAPAPEWLTTRIAAATRATRRPPGSRANRGPSARYAGPILEGTRHTTLTAYVRGLSNSFARDEVATRASALNFVPPLPAKDIERAVNWGARVAAAGPRRRRAAA